MNNLEPMFHIKDGCSPTPEMLQYMHPAVVLMVAWTNLWCRSNGLKPVWTSWIRTPEQNKALNASSVHVYRGADLSCDRDKGWTVRKQKLFINSFSAVFKRVGAYTYAKDGRTIRKPVIKHDSGHGMHFHLQVNPYAKMEHIRSNLEEWTNEDQ